MRRLEKFLILQSSEPSDGKSDSIRRIGSFEQLVSRNRFKNYVIQARVLIKCFACVFLRISCNHVVDIFPVRLFVEFLVFSCTYLKSCDSVHVIH